ARSFGVGIGQVQAQLRAQPEVGGDAQAFTAAVDFAQGRADPARQQQRGGRFGNLAQPQPGAGIGQAVAGFQPAQAVAQVDTDAAAVVQAQYQFGAGHGAGQAGPCRRLATAQ